MLKIDSLCIYSGLDAVTANGISCHNNICCTVAKRHKSMLTPSRNTVAVPVTLSEDNALAINDIHVQ